VFHSLTLRNVRNVDKSDKFNVITDSRLSRLLIIDVDSVLELLYGVDVSYISDISEVRAASVFGVIVCI
jgi:hypothetical protein